MAITILPPAPATPASARSYKNDRDVISDEGSDLDLEGDVDMLDSGRPSKRARLREREFITPGQAVTDDPQWMRYPSPTLSNSPPLSHP